MNEQFYAYVVVTLLTVALMYGIFQGSTKSTFRALEKTLETMSAQINELRNDQKEMASLSTRVYGIDLKIKSLEKCQDHTTSDLDAIQVRLNKLREDI